MLPAGIILSTGVVANAKTDGSQAAADAATPLAEATTNTPAAASTEDTLEAADTSNAIAVETPPLHHCIAHSKLLIADKYFFGSRMRIYIQTRLIYLKII